MSRTGTMFSAKVINLTLCDIKHGKGEASTLEEPHDADQSVFRVVSQKNMMSPKGPETKNNCAGEDQQ
jgi:hypothetical protein